jgi:hypothetical protein
VFNPLLIFSDAAVYRPNQYQYAGLGDVYNTSASQAFSVTLDVQVSSPLNGIYTATVPTALVATLPHEFNPFFVYLGSDQDQLVTKLAIHAVSPLSAAIYQSLIVTPEQLHCDYGAQASLHGTMRNAGSAALHSIRVAAWSLEGINASFGVIDFGSQYIQPGETLPFAIYNLPLCWYSLLAPGVSIEKFHVVAQGVRDL